MPPNGCGDRAMSKRWQWALLSLYLVVLMVLSWYRMGNLVYFVTGAALAGQGIWYLWRHHRQQNRQEVPSIGWFGWGNLALGVAFTGLALFSLTEMRQPVAAKVETWCGRVWGPNQRRPDECGADALRPMPLGRPVPGAQTPATASD